MAQAQRALQSLGKLSSIQLSREGGAAIELFRQVSGIQAEIARLRSRRDDLEEQIGDRDESGLLESQRKWKLVQDGLAHARMALSNARQKLSEHEAGIKRLQEQIRAAVGPSAGAETERREYIEALRDVVERSVSCYREALRAQVEKDASELFKQMTTETEYEGLAITSSYGLRIIHRDGTEVPLRSSGTEHVVALSLVGALQKNSPVRGPLFIDSPFGRLDSRHKEQVIASLPTMADQVVLFVYSKEVDENVARRVLAGQLLCEYELVRVSARETQIERRRR
jgi:DNA sulfur modification protein DndD